MTDPYLIPCLKTLRAEFNALDPGRDKDSDGWIGDEAHQQETSDHNPDSQGRVLAIDIDSTGPWPAPFGDIVESLRGDSRLEYVIWNRRIASRSKGWTWRTYGGDDPHTNHAHFSARHDHTGGTSTAPWGLDEFMPLTADDKKWLTAQFEMVAEKVWATKIGNANYPGRDALHALNDLSTERDYLVDPNVTAEEAKVAAGTPLARLVEAADVLLAPPPPTA